MIVFGLLKRNSKVYTIIVPDTKSTSLMPIISNKITLGSIVYTDHWHSYNALDVAGFSHHRINHLSHFADGQNHINGIDRKAFPLFIKECEFRFNYGSAKQQLKTLLKYTEI